MAYKRKRSSTKTKKPYKKYKGSASSGKVYSSKKYAVKYKKKSFKKAKMYQRARKVGTAHWLTTLTSGVAKPVPLRYKTARSNVEGVNATFQMLITTGDQVVQGTAVNVYAPYDCYFYNNVTAIGGQDQNYTYMKSCLQTTIGTNQTDANIFLTAYECTARNDCVAGGSHPSPRQDWISGDAGTSSVFVGGRPYISKAFVTNWKVTKVTEFNLSQGESFKYVKNVHVNRTLTNQRIPDYAGDSQSGPAAGSIGGLTQYTMWVAYGAAYNDTTTKTQISSGAGTIDFITSKEYTYYNLAVATGSSTFTDSLPNDFTVSQSIMNIDSGAVVVETVA